MITATILALIIDTMKFFKVKEPEKKFSKLTIKTLDKTAVIILDANTFQLLSIVKYTGN